MSDQSDAGSARPPLDSGPNIHPGVVLAGLVLVLLAVFVLQNGNDAKVHFLWMKGETSLWLVIVLSALAGAVIALLTSWWWQLRRRRD